MNLILIAFHILSITYFSNCSSENDKRDIVNNDFDDITSTTTIENNLDTSFQVPDEKWTSKALKNIAHYLRNYKFNAWDHRYYTTKPKNDSIGYYDSFPIPVLRSLHWKVYQNCDNDFYKCITYLESVIQIVPFARSDDVVTFLNEKVTNNVTVIKKLNYECAQTLLDSERNSFPFDSRIEKFQWRTTASYYMCWYAMLGTPALSMLGEICDNFANCIDPNFGYRNRDPRSDDRLSFACATYSFCPDPCCPLKHIDHIRECYENKFNPCFNENRERPTALKKCNLDRKENRNFKSIIKNKWNVSCNCKKTGFIWKSQFGICVDVNECLSKKNPCNSSTEICLNTPGSFKCVCKWGSQFDIIKNKCVSNFHRKIKDHSVLNNTNVLATNIIIRFLNYFGLHK